MRFLANNRGLKGGRVLHYLARATLWLRKCFSLAVVVEDGDQRYRFACSNKRELSRSVSALTKEPGTYQWIRSNIQLGEIVYDIGANIGVYTVMAAAQVGPTGVVYAFEPHGANFAQLLNNIAANELGAVVRPCSIALHDTQTILDFHYRYLVPGSSESQLGKKFDAVGYPFESELTEPKLAISIDELVFRHSFLSPHHIKIDVDGNELLIVTGMQRLLRCATAPKSIQIEINQNSRVELFRLMRESGYEPVQKHYTRKGLRLIEQGHDPEDYSYNAVFQKAHVVATEFRTIER